MECKETTIAALNPGDVFYDLRSRAVADHARYKWIVTDTRTSGLSMAPTYCVRVHDGHLITRKDTSVVDVEEAD